MILAKVSFTALCCFIAHTVRCSATAVVDDTVLPASAKQRTLLQEMLILSEMLNLSPFNERDLKAKPALPSRAVQTTRLQKIRAELTMLKTTFDAEKGIFNAKKKEVTAPNYKGLNRYYFVKGLLNSMAIKFECLKEYLLRVTSESPVEIKEKLVEFHFGNKDDIIANLTLNELKSFYKLFYDGDAPIPNLRKHFSDYESKLKQGETLTATANPISAFFTDNSENGEELKQLDKANADMVIYTSRPGNLPLRLPGNAEPDAVDESSRDDSNAETEDTVEQTENTVNSRDGTDNHTASQDVPTSDKVTPGPSVKVERSESESLPSGDENVVQHPSKPGVDVGVESPELQVQETTKEEDVPDAPSPPTVGPSPPSVDPSPTRASAQSATSSLRTESAEKLSQKASSAFDSFVTVLLVVSAVFTL